MHTVDVNTGDLVKMANRLDSLRRYDLPLAVRGTLNSLAFDVKQRTLLEVTAQEFTIRQKNFFRANSRVDRADGFDINRMVSVVGMVGSGLKGGNNYAVDDLAAQEKGGTIGGRSMIPISKGARVSGSYAKNVRKKARISNITQVIDSKKMTGQSDAEKFIKASIIAGVGGHVIGTEKNGAGNRTVFEIKKITRGGDGNTRIGAIPLYVYKAGRVVKVKPTRFMQKSGNKTIKKLPAIFEKEGRRRIEKSLK